MTTTDTACPVCAETAGDPAVCPACGWELEGPYRLGAVTPSMAEDFARRLADARRGIDLAAVVRAAQRHGRVETELLGRLLTLVRGGPVPEPQWRDAVTAAEQRADPPWPAAATVVVEADPDGIVVPRFAADLVENAEPATWPWTELVSGLPAGAEERRFRLAGGVAAARVTPDVVAVRALADRLPAGAVVLADLTGGWALPGKVLDTLAGRRGEVRRWASARAGDRQTQTLRLPGEISAFAGSSTGELVAGARGGTLWWWPDGSPGAVGGDRVLALAVHSGLVVSGHRSGEVRIRAVGSGAPADVLTRHNGWVNGVGLAGRTVFSVGDDGAVRATPLDSGQPGFRAEVGFSTASALAVDQDATVLAVGGSDYRIRIFDGRTGQERAAIRNTAPVTRLALAPDGRQLAAGGADGSILLHDLTGSDAPRPAYRMAGAIGALLLDAAGLVAGDVDGLLVSQDRTGAATVLGRYGGAVRGVARMPDGRIAAAGADGLIRVWRSRRHDREDH
ncbi:hypothetical protein [Actinoplanes sp. NPDC026670]|uniref:WD40 repeat domain-containing protein n=1 Tax=Actinoplanes sp. NPDC026670 TaxID=3154700 RepID=UPI00340BF2D4